MAYTAKKFDHLIGLSGFSDDLLTNHFTLYEGYVKNTNLLAEKLKSLTESGETAGPDFAELKRRFGWEWNGMRMHELYFGNMTKDTTTLTNEVLKAKFVEIYGSVENWEKNFIATGAIRGIGWVVLAHDTESGKLYNVWVNEHDAGHLVGTTPLLVMDVFEHAFVLDYGTKRADYVNAFMQAIDWSMVEKRFEHH